MLRNTCLIFVSVATFVGCAPETRHDEAPADSAASSVLKQRKALGGSNGDADYCNSTDSICDSGEGDCDGDAQCAGALLCGVDNGPFFGFPSLYDVCVPAHCRNGVKDEDEEYRDCGGADCGSDCSSFCSSLPANGEAGRCTTDCPCPSGEGDCNLDSQCASGLVCGTDNGAQFGFVAGLDVCVPAHCENGLWDADEVSVDCGGADCGGTCDVVCSAQPSNGEANHCSADCPCPPAEGDCGNDAHCAQGSECVDNVGASFGFAAGVDVCLATHCSNALLDGDETDVDCGPSCLPCGGDTVFVRTAGAANPDILHSAAVGKDGASVVVGRFTGTTNLGGSSLSSNGGADVFVAKFSALGEHIWSTSFGGPFNDGDHDLAIDVAPDGGVIVSGNFYDSVDFGAGSVSSAGSSDVFVVKLDASGNHVWTRRVGGTDRDMAHDVFVSTVNQVYVSGSFKGTVDFGGGSVASAGDYDAYVLKLDGSSGSYIASATFGGDGSDRGYAVVSGAGSQVWLAGGFSSTASFGAYQVTSTRLQDIFVAKLTHTLQPSWVRRFGGESNDFARGVIVDASARATVVGVVSRSTDFGTGGLAYAGGTDAFVAQLDSTGTVTWAEQFGSTGSDRADSVALGPSDAVWVAGYLAGDSANFPGGAVTGSGGYDAFVAKYSVDGSTKEGSLHGGTGDDFFRAVDTDGTAFFVAGYFTGSGDFLGQSQTSSGERDLVFGRVHF